jgi:hypothetical protein
MESPVIILQRKQKKGYVPPKLVVYGSAAERTRGAGQNLPDATVNPGSL